MTNFLGLVLLISISSVFSFVTPPINNRNSKLFLHDKDYELAKEYYEYKTKQLKKYKSVKYEFYDDAKPIIELFKTYPNVRMVNANTANGVVQHG